MNYRELHRQRIEDNKRKRSERVAAANLKGRHTKQEWQEMKDFFDNTCVRCFGESDLIHVEKDHIIPLYQGSSNGLDNLQPLCALCNSSKGAEDIDWRPIAAKKLNKELPEKYKVNG